MSASRRLLVCLLLAGSTAFAAGVPALVRAGRLGPGDRDFLLAAGVPIVKEFESFLLAYGPAEALLPRLEALGFSARVLDRPRTGETYHLLGLRAGFAPPSGPECGARVWQEENFLIVKTQESGRPPCASGPAIRWSPLALEPLRPTKSTGGIPPRTLEFLPLVQEMTNGLTDELAADALEEVVGWAATRYSFSAGCQAAVEAAQAAFAAAGVPVRLQDWSSKFPPNVVAELRGETRPDEILIVIAHLDDMPDIPPAPGADDNASGSAMVLALARVMAPYRFAGTVKFILVAGEEQGLVGSTYYARDADRRGEDIRAVLNADMIGWQGDGDPEPEDIDVNYDTASKWLADLMHEAANLYETGGPVNAFYCPSMVYSDHAPFWDLGWSALCGITDNEGLCSRSGTYPYYHTHADTIANCGDLTFLAAAGRTYLASLAQLAVPLGRRDGSAGHRRPLEHP